MPRNTPKPPSNIRVGQRFVLGSQKLGKGSFGSIYLGTDTENDGDVAVKLVRVFCFVLFFFFIFYFF